MNSLFRQLIVLTEEFEQDYPEGGHHLSNFADWLGKKIKSEKYSTEDDLDWEGKSKGRSAESIINTSLIHLYRYAKIYSKLAILDSPFSTIDDVIFLINLLHRGGMTKTQLIEMNIHEKSTGIQIINRLLDSGFVAEVINERDRRSKHISITEEGKNALEANMDKIRQASKIVVGNLSEKEKMQLIRLLQKLEAFHEDKVKERIRSSY